MKTTRFNKCEMYEQNGFQKPGTPNNQLLFVLETESGVGRTNTTLNARQTKYDIQNRTGYKMQNM